MEKMDELLEPILEAMISNHIGLWEVEKRLVNLAASKQPEMKLTALYEQVAWDLDISTDTVRRYIGRRK